MGIFPRACAAWGVEDDAFLTADATNLLERLHDAYLVIDSHDGDETTVRANRIRKEVKVNEAIRADREIGDLETILLEAAARVEDALVLRLSGDYMALAGAVETHEALDGDVVALGGAGCEKYLLVLVHI